jgi:hypothetical protein
MEQYFFAAGMKDPNTVVFAEAFLRDTAADWWRMQTTQSSQVVTDWDSFKVCFQLIGRPENASLRRKTRKTIKTLVFDGESNGVGLEKLKLFS